MDKTSLYKLVLSILCIGFFERFEKLVEVKLVTFQFFVLDSGVSGMCRPIKFSRLVSTFQFFVIGFKN